MLKSLSSLCIPVTASGSAVTALRDGAGNSSAVFVRSESRCAIYKLSIILAVVLLASVGILMKLVLPLQCFAHAACFDQELHWSSHITPLVLGLLFLLVMLLLARVVCWVSTVYNSDDTRQLITPPTHETTQLHLSGDLSPINSSSGDDLPVNVAIVGCGPRGLTILERIIAQCMQLRTSRTIVVHVFDSSDPGTGCHSTKQPEDLLVNTVASQITMFSDSSVREAGPVLMGPSFFEWLNDAAASTERDDQQQMAVTDTYYPRCVLGSYLRWVYDYIVRHASKFVTVVHHRTAVLDISRREGGRWRLELSTGQPFQDVDFVFLTTGHTAAELSPTETALGSRVRSLQITSPQLDVIFDPYPIMQPKLALITPNHTVAIEGAGLAACDVIAVLTTGRGGRFHRVAHGAGDALEYIRSGNEPRLVLFSRSGVPLSARALNQKGVSEQYKAKFLSAEYIQRLRQRDPPNGLDFETEVLPLLLLDMSYAYYFSMIKCRSSLTKAMEFGNAFTCAKDDSARSKVLAEYLPSGERFCIDKLFSPVPATARVSQECFRSWLLSFLADDLVEAQRGNIDSPLKAACDVIRDLRDILRSAVDFGGLKDDSHKWFLNVFVPVMNRLAVGPPKARAEQLLALIRADVVRFDLGPAPTCILDDQQACFVIRSTAFEAPVIKADVLIRARIALPVPADDQSPLMGKLLSRGLLRPFKNGGLYPGGIEVDKNLNVVTASGLSLSNVWALGTLTEGCKFYTYVLPRPGVGSTAVVDAGRAVGQMMAAVFPKGTLSAH